MIATGETCNAAISTLKDWGAKTIKVVSFCSSNPGISRLANIHSDVSFITGVVDPEINEHGYLVPGYGDIGDRLFSSNNV
ncbi:Uracil phosphoribosyltransferase [Smittium culicis]|uniref:Uracil phosphoribosyltransferase n=1 Tax=Smittium culicis TaxID=133412 RepID=A0A1R1YP70_9FUNG|nr:Uracil phosphoribosyltransferase [Smittium culicis]